MERDPTKFQAIPEDFIITPPKLEKSTEARAWAILGRPLEKARKYVTDPSKAPKGVKVQRGKKGGYYYEAEPVRTSLKTQPEKVRAAVKDLYAEGYDAKMIASELEEKHGIKVHPETVNRFLKREGVETTRVPRKTVSRKDVEEREQTISEQAKQIEDMGGEIETLKDDVKFYKDKYESLTMEAAETKQQIANLRAAVEALKTGGSEETTEVEGGHVSAKPEPKKETTERDTSIYDQPQVNPTTGRESTMTPQAKPEKVAIKSKSGVAMPFALSGTKENPEIRVDGSFKIGGKTITGTGKIQHWKHKGAEEGLYFRDKDVYVQCASEISKIKDAISKLPAETYSAKKVERIIDSDGYKIPTMKWEFDKPMKTEKGTLIPDWQMGAFLDEKGIDDISIEDAVKMWAEEREDAYNELKRRGDAKAQAMFDDDVADVGYQQACENAGIPKGLR